MDNPLDNNHNNNPIIINTNTETSDNNSISKPKKIKKVPIMAVDTQSASTTTAPIAPIKKKKEKSAIPKGDKSSTTTDKKPRVRKVKKEVPVEFESGSPTVQWIPKDENTTTTTTTTTSTSSATVAPIKKKKSKKPKEDANVLSLKNNFETIVINEPLTTTTTTTTTPTPVDTTTIIKKKKKTPKPTITTTLDVNNNNNNNDSNDTTSASTALKKEKRVKVDRKDKPKGDKKDKKDKKEKKSSTTSSLSSTSSTFIPTTTIPTTTATTTTIPKTTTTTTTTSSSPTLKSHSQQQKKSYSTSNNNNNNNKEDTPEKKKKTRVFYKTYVEKPVMEKGLEEGRYFYGTIRVNAKKYYDAYITVEGATHDVFCGGLKDRNRAFNTDVVVFEVLDEKDWKKRPKKDDDEETDEIAMVLKDVTTDVNETDEGTVVLENNQDFNRKVEMENKLLKSYLVTDNDSSFIEISDSEDESVATSVTSLVKLETKQIVNSESEEDSSDEGFVKINNNNTSTTTTTTTTTTATPLKVNKKLQQATEEQKVYQNIAKIEQLGLKAFEMKSYVSVRVVAILESKHQKSHVGIMVDENVNSIFTNFIPMDTTLPKCCIFKESIPQYKSNPDKYKKSLVSVGYSGWKETSLLPIGHYKSLFGECGKIEPETHALLAEFGVETDPFSKGVMDCLPKINQAKLWLPSALDLHGRRDLRNVEICTIDPDTAKDLDDALHCIALEDGNFEVGVHIADVSHFVKQGNELDKCAARKATTVYLVQKAIPMLPSLLSEELCSLNMGVERLAFSVIWKLSPTGEILDEWFGRSVIKSFARLTYGIAQALIDGKINNAWEDFIPQDRMRNDLGPNTPEHIARVKSGVLGLREIAKHMRAARIANGAFTIHPSKLAFALDDKGNPVSTKIYPIYESNNLVEEYMLLANMRVAERIGKFFPSNALLRRHPSPNENKLEAFIAFCAKHGFEIDSSSSYTFGESIKKLKDTCSDLNILMAIQLLSIRSMKLAEYFCSSMEEEEDWRHYALNAPYYTHFTSPIRRYADIIVHRLLDLSIRIENAKRNHDEQTVTELYKQLPSSESLGTISGNCNEKKLNARKAQERSDKVFLCVLLENHPTITSAVALNTGISFIAVIVPQFGSEQKVYLDDLQQQGTIISHSYNATDGINIINWPSLSDPSKVVTQKISQLTTMKVQIQVNKDKFPIDTRCVLIHPDTPSTI